MNFSQDPFFIGMLITLAIAFVVVVWAARPYLRDLFILAVAVPQVLFKKAFGDPPSEDDAH